MSELGERVRSGEIRALARAATIVENRLPEADELLKELFPHTGRALVLGITGSPGAGKSTLVAAIARQLRVEGKTVAVIAVDPTSPYSGGAILGDRIRMQDHHGDDGVFIRSMATRGWMGGLARTTTDMSVLFDAAGRDVILVETVGVGQDEVEIARLADVTVLLLVPGMGDDVQAIKAGIMEIADVFVINKSDQPGADKLEHEVKASLSLARRPDNWTPPIVRAIASKAQGIEETLAAARSFYETGKSRSRAQEIWALRLREMLRDRLIENFPKELFDRAAAEIAARKTDPYSMIQDWLRNYPTAPTHES
jgi:LAO/AO transport system kinase